MSTRRTFFRRPRIHGLVSLLALASCLACGPIGPFSGGRLSGQEAGYPDDWSRVSDVMQIQLETGPSDPHSVNLWLAVVDRDAYVATSLLSGAEDPTDREWVRNVAGDPRVRVRIDDVVYSGQLEPVEDAERRGQIFEAFLVKYPHLELSRKEGSLYYRIAKSSDDAM